MAVPRYPRFIDPLLRVLAEAPDGLSAAAAHEAVASRLGLSEADKAELLPSGQQPVFKNRNGWAHDRLKRAGLSESSTFGVWRLTRAGVEFVREHPAPLNEDEVARLIEKAKESQSLVWRDRWNKFENDASWARERDSARDEHRARQREILGLIERYLSGALGLEELGVGHPRQANAARVSLGVDPGLTLEALARLAPEPSRADSELRRLLRKPLNEAAAASALRGFARYVTELRAASPAATELPNGAQLPAFASYFWHVQSPDQWPLFTDSAREALAAEGLYDAGGADVVDDYLAFRRAFLQVREALDVPAWQLESLLQWTRATAHPRSPAGEHTPGATPRIWLIALGRNADQWDTCRRDGIIAIGWNGLGDLLQYESLAAVREKLREGRESDADPMNAGLACWQFAREMQENDVVYVKRGRHFIIGHGVITSGYRHEPGRPLANVRDVQWHGHGEWRLQDSVLVTKTLTEIGKYPGLIQEIRRTLGLDEETPEEVASLAPAIAPYGFEDAEKDLFLRREQLRELLELCRYKKNVILQGPPGVGKTFAATRLAYLLIGSMNESQIQRVQFHPSYSYEDFVQGFRPADGGGFARKDGPLLRFCKDALEDQASPYVLLIDEINRGNISKILGELLSLLEPDKRDPRYGVTLAYARDDEPRFHVPPNLYVIGMMNTADRALAFVDYALRRRFAFFDLEPAFGTERLDAELTRRGVEAPLRGTIEGRLRALNERLAADARLGPGFRVGHSYFCQAADAYDEAWFQRIVDYEIAPLLREYWCEDGAELDHALAELEGR